MHHPPVPSISVTGPDQLSLDPDHRLHLDYPDIPRLFNTDLPPLKSQYDLQEAHRRFFTIVYSKDQRDWEKNPLRVQVDLSVSSLTIEKALGTERYNRLPQTVSGSRCLTIKCRKPLQSCSLTAGNFQHGMNYSQGAETYILAKKWGTYLGTLPNGSEVQTKIGIKWLLPRERIPKHVLDSQSEGRDLVLRPQDFVSLDEAVSAAKLTCSGKSMDDNLLDRLLSGRRGCVDYAKVNLTTGRYHSVKKDSGQTCVESGSIMCMHYVYNSVLPPKSPNHLLKTSNRPPKGPFSSAAKPTSKHPRQFRLNVSRADNAKATIFDQDNLD
jgi:hypothetical protein